MKFLNVLQFLAPRYNLKSFFKGFGVSEQKGFFPYDYFTHADQLDETPLPSYETFYSTIKNCNVLEEEQAAFQKLKKNGLTTPLIKLYLEHGLVITRIYTTVEYIPNATFSSFMTQIAHCRLEGGHDKYKALIAEMSNSSVTVVMDG